MGYFEFTSDELSAVRENLRSILVTNRGERVMHYNFGCNLIEFIFEPDRSDDLKEKIADRIVSQVGLWMPFVSINELNVVLSDEDTSLPQNSIAVRIVFSLNSRPDLTAIMDHLVT